MLIVWKPLKESAIITGLCSLDLPIQSCIELLAASRDPDAALSNLTKLSCSDEASRSWLPDVRNDEVTKIDR
jgi:hypothetical protein